MHAKALRTWMVAAVVFAAAGAEANDCTVPQQEHPLADRQGTIARLENMPQQCLREMFRQCTDAARASLLDLGSAAACSMGYEALLRKHFGGNFQALMAWWQSEQRTASMR